MSEIAASGPDELELIGDYYGALPRQGPGSAGATLKALSFIEHLSTDSHIADLGCGTGGQTLVLAQQAPGQITAIDLLPAFIQRLNANAAKLHLQPRVRGVVGSMDTLPFAGSSLDLIWSEGAIYNIGFARGLQAWRQFLKAGGAVAVTEVCWLRDAPPAEIRQFWTGAYPQIDSITNKLAQLQAAGYRALATFVLPEHCWTENYYQPQQAVQQRLLETYAGNRLVEEFVRAQRQEADLYARYGQYYGYVFFVARKQ